MRSIKTHGGLTREKGMTENQRLVWVLSMPVCAIINKTMQKFSGVSYETSDQHKDVSAARQARDVSDTVDLIDYLNERDPFAAAKQGDTCRLPLEINERRATEP